MKPRDYVLEQIHHHATRPVPFTLGFEGDVAERVDAHYGSKDWRQRLTPFMAHVSAVQTDIREPISETHVRDGYKNLAK